MDSPIGYYVLCVCLVLTGVTSAAPQIEQWHTENGVKVLFVAAAELPILDIAVTFDAGSGRDAELAGISQLTHSLLNAGAGKSDADAIAEKFEDVGAQFSVSVAPDRSNVTLRSLSDEELFKQALSAFITVLARPDFPEKDFLRLQKQALIATQEAQQRPGEVARRAFYKAVYTHHPYAQPTLGYQHSIHKISLDDIKKFYHQYLVAENAIMAIVGDIDIGRAKLIAQQVSSSLASGNKPPPIPDPKPRRSAEAVHVPYPSQQAHVYLGQLGIRRGDPDYFTLYVGNHVLGGGGFTSRLVKEVRVARGLSYSIYSYFLPMRQPGPFISGLQTRADQAQQAVQVCLQTIEKFMAEGPTAEELALAKRNVIGGFPLRIDNNRDILGYLSLIGYYDLPLDYLHTFTHNVAAVTREDVREAFARRLQLNNMVKIIVGGPQKK